jgi:zinc transport system ATP-binding protein
MNEPLVEVDRLTVKFGSELVLDNVSLEVRRGSLVSLLGPNGAGKSTLLKAIAGLAPITSGRIIKHTERIGYVPQQIPLDQALPVTVAEFLSLKACKSRLWVGRRADRQKIKLQLEEMGAVHLVDRRLGELSGGEFQRILLSYALLNQPELLLLDEPLTGVDIRGGLSFDGLMHHLHEHRRVAVLMVSHDLHLVEHLSDSVYCINRDVCCHGHPAEVLKPENLAKAYGHLPGRVMDRGGGAFFPVSRIS